MQKKKTQHILFTKDNSSKNRSLLTNLLKRYPFSLNIRYKHLAFNALHSKELDPVELKKLSTYAIDKQFLKMRFKKLNKHKDSYWLNPKADQAVIQQSNLPEESLEQEAVQIPPTKIIEPKTNQKEQKVVEQKTNELNLTMSTKNNKDEKGDSAKETRFTDWLEGLKKSRKSDEKDKQSLKSEKKKKKKKKKKNKKDKAKKKQELEHAEIISETLAELMAKQGYTEKAIEMYNRLRLLFPEKNTYFASKIEDLNN